MNFLTIVVAAVVAFASSVVWYAVFGKAMADLRGSNASAGSGSATPPI